MKLVGKKAIMAYLHRSPISNSSWQRVKARYAAAIRWDTETRRVWSDTAWLDQADLARSTTLSSEGKP
ncbi:MAG: hypothetical protein WC713_07380 [Candidatus Methylomirabilota bacterium]